METEQEPPTPTDKRIAALAGLGVKAERGNCVGEVVLNARETQKFISALRKLKRIESGHETVQDMPKWKRDSLRAYFYGQSIRNIGTSVQDKQIR